MPDELEGSDVLLERWSWRSVAGTPRCRRYAFAHGIGEAIEIASELWFCINETTSDDLAN